MGGTSSGSIATVVTRQNKKPISRAGVGSGVYGTVEEEATTSYPCCKNCSEGKPCYWKKQEKEDRKRKPGPGGMPPK